jgi:glycosyltransferase involved in cell wall biosynthesis
MRLSVLTPTVPPRHGQLNKLLKYMASQQPEHTEFLIFTDNFENTIGEKRNKLLRAASGDFVIFVDDDDWLHPSYFEIINQVLDYKEVDYIAYRMARFWNGKQQKDEYRSIRYKKCFTDEYGSYRHISHTNPIKRTICSNFSFPDKSLGEDADWCEEIFLSGSVKTEFFINLPMYEQRYARTKKQGPPSKLEIPTELTTVVLQ